MTETDFATVTDRMRGLYNKWKPTTEQLRWFASKVMSLHENDVIGALDSYVLNAKTTYAPNLGAIAKAAWANKQNRTGETHSGKVTETPIEALRRMYKMPHSMTDHEVVCRVAAGDIRAHEQRRGELSQPHRWSWIFNAVRHHFSVDEAIYWADRWCGECPDEERKVREVAARRAEEYARYERGELKLGQIIKAAMRRVDLKDVYAEASQ